MNSRLFTIKLIALFVVLSFAAVATGDVNGSGITPDEAIERLQASGEDEAAVASMLKEIHGNGEVEQRDKAVSGGGHGRMWLGVFGAIVAVVLASVVFIYARTTDQHGRSRLRATLGAKLAAGFSAILVVTAVLSIYCMNSMQGVGARIEELAEETIPLTEHVGTIETHQLEQAITLERAFRFGNETTASAKERFETAVQQFEEHRKKADEEFAAAIEMLEKTPAHSHERAEALAANLNALVAMEAEHREFEVMAEKAVELIREGQLARARLLEEHVEKAEDELDHKIEEFMGSLLNESKVAARHVEAQEQRAAFVMPIAVIAAIIIGIGIAVYQTRRLTRRIGQTVDIADRVAAGDLTKQLDASGSDELGQLARAINRMIGNLQEVVQQIGTAGTNMVGASREQAEGAKSQSTATAEMTSTVAELTTSATRMSENGAAVSEQAELASKECSAGSLSVQNAVQGIQGIHERVEKIAEHMLDLGGKSQQISGILDIITELSEQTNLLSLNASIEAAGAGEAGKRFAVVASEIRKLAERATDSTVEIRALIDSIQETVNTTIMATEEGTKAVQHGVRMSEDVEASLQRIAQQVGATTESAKSIEMGSRQQATAIQQMEEAVRNIDAAAQQSEATARQVDGEAHTLLESARRLQTSDQQLLAV